MTNWLGNSVSNWWEEANPFGGVNDYDRYLGSPEVGLMGGWDSTASGGTENTDIGDFLSGGTDWGTLLGHAMGNSGMKMQQAQTPPQRQIDLSGLMSMATRKEPQKQRPGQMYQSPYIQSLMNI